MIQLVAATVLTLAGCQRPAPTPDPPRARVVSWLDLAEPEGTPRGSRSQAIFLRDVARKLPDVDVQVHDVSALNDAGRRKAIVAWRLGEVTVQPGSREAVPEVPTTVVLDPLGAEVDRWIGLAPQTDLELATRAARGESVCRPSPLQQPFPGLPPVRRVLEGLWLDDGAAPWTPGAERPVRWISATPEPVTVGREQLLATSLGDTSPGVGPPVPLWASRSTLRTPEPGCLTVQVHQGQRTGQLVLQVR